MTSQKHAHASDAHDDQDTEIMQLKERLADLEAKNQRLREAPFVPPPTPQGALDADRAAAAAQGVITARKNSNADLVQVTRSGNVRTTRDPSDTFISEQSTGGQYGDAAMAEAHDDERKDTPS